MSPNTDNSDLIKTEELQYFHASVSREGVHLNKEFLISDLKYSE